MNVLRSNYEKNFLFHEFLYMFTYINLKLIFRFVYFRDLIKKSMLDIRFFNIMG